MVLLSIIEGAEPFLFRGDDRGVLLVHGFTGSPAEMRLLGEYLNNQGYTVMAPRLCGHGSTVEEMAQTKWPHWYSAVEDGYHILRSLCKEVSVVGLSMGAILSLHLAAEYPVKKIVSLSAPIFLQDRRLPLLPVYRLFQNFVHKKQRKYDVDPKYNIGYQATPLDSLDSLLQLIKTVQGQLKEITAPSLMIQPRREHTVRPESAQYIYDHIGSCQKQLIWLEKSGHVVTLDNEREKVFEEINRFLGTEG